MLVYNWVNKEKNRFYKITIEKEKAQVLMKYHWGSCTSNRAGKKDLFVSSEEDCKKTIEQMLKRRKSRGYELISPRHGVYVDIVFDQH